MTLLLIPLLGLTPVQAASGPPRRPVPDPVLAELADLEDRFERALALDCEVSRCFSTGCTYVDHRVADRPRSSSLPGLGEKAGIGSVAPQPWLTQAQCGFAHEPAATPEDVRVLVRRLQSKVTTGWTSVSVSAKAMDPLPAYLRSEHTLDAPEEAPVEPPPPPPEPTAGEQLWDALLPHLFWMVGGLLFTLAAVVLVWAFRRVGKASIEEEMLMAQMAADAQAAPPPVEVEEDGEAVRSAAYVAEQQSAWARRLASIEPQSPDPALHALVRDRLRSGDIPFLAKAALRFPDHFPAVFPDGGDVAAAKLALADYLRTADMAGLPDDTTFFEALNRHAVAASVASQADADVVRRLREDFGAAGLADTILGLPPRIGGLLYAWAAPGMQVEVGRLLSPRQVAAMSDQLLRSNRMDAHETDQLFSVVRGEAPSASGRVTDQGAELDVAGALSLLLSGLARGTRNQLLGDAVARFHGAVPGWMRDIFVADMLSVLPAEARTDLLLGVDVQALAAWLAGQDPSVAADLRSQMPDSLRATMSAISIPTDPGARAAAAREGQRALARGLQVELARLGMPFEAVLADSGEAGGPA